MNGCNDCFLERRLVTLLKAAFEAGRNGGGGKVAPREWQQMLRNTKIQRAELLRYAKKEAQS